MARGSDHALLHVMVVGFHHKKGCQIEYAYPAFDGVEDDSTSTSNGAANQQPSANGASSDASSSHLRNSFSFEMPADWRRLLPSLALPDGAHHWGNDAVFFTLPFHDAADAPFTTASLSSATVFGISCCRQIDAKELTRSTDEITRNTVQKSICVLTSIPAYGLAEALLKPVTQAYFEQKDFERKEIIKELFQQLAASLTLQLPNCPSTPPRSALAYMQEDSQLFIGLSARDFVLRFRHNFLLLVKLVLLEKKVLFYGPPSKTNVYALSGETILTLLSLFPKMIEDGLYFSCEVPSEDDDDANDARGSRYDDDDDDVGLSLKSGGQSLSEDYLVVTHRPVEEDDTGVKAVHGGDASDLNSSALDSGLENRRREKEETTKYAASSSTETALPPPAMTTTAATEDETVDGALGSDEVSWAPGQQPSAASRTSNLKASLRAPRKRVNGGNGRDRSASPLCLPRDDGMHHPYHVSRNVGKDDHLLDAETQSLSSLCVEPPLSVNDNLDDRMDDLSLDEEVMDEMRVETLDEELDDEESIAFSSNVPESKEEKNKQEFTRANDTGEDALLDEIDQIMSASSKGPDRLGLNDGTHADVDDLGAAAILSPEEDAGRMKHSESKASILSERSANLASRASMVKTKLFDVWKGNWGFGNEGDDGDDGGSPPGSGGGSVGASKGDDSRSSSPSKSVGRGGAGERSVDCGMDVSQSPSVEHLSIDGLGNCGDPSAPSSSHAKLETTRMSQDSFGFPFAVFEKGYLCLPYASLQHLDVVTSQRVRGFLIGATNILFKQKSKLADVVVTVESSSSSLPEDKKMDEGPDGGNEDSSSSASSGNSFEFEWRDPDLKRLVTLTTADLRFADEILRQVEAVDDSSTWEGGDEWIRAQIKTYLQSILVTSIKGDQHQLHDFNAAFVFAWQNTTRNYRVWHGRATGPDAWPGVDADLEASHPGASLRLSVNDIKLKMSHTISSTQSGRKITAAAATTSKAVVSTGKAVGGAIYSARTSISSWWHGGKRSKMEEESDDVDPKSTDEPT